MRNQPFQGTDHTMHDYGARGVPAVNGTSGFSRNRLALLCCLSLLCHMLIILAVARFGTMNFAGPVVAVQIIAVDLKELKTPAAQPALIPESDQKAPPPITLTSGAVAAVPVVTRSISVSRHTVDEKTESQLTPVSNIVATEFRDNYVEPFGADRNLTLASPANGTLPVLLANLPPPIREVAEFFGHKYEKLTFQISMYGIPVGEARLEATNNNGELRIISRVKFNAAMSLVYPVDNETETRMFNGRYIMTTIKRREGDKQTDVGFTLCLGEKNVFWADRLNKRYYNNSVPTDQVMDMISGFYFLRNQQLEVGKSVTLNLFDNNTFASTPVHVLRKERVRLLNFREVEAFVIQPQLATNGIFDKTGDLFIWLTADGNSVPVKLETSIPLGRVTAELVSAESER